VKELTREAVFAARTDDVGCVRSLSAEDLRARSRPGELTLLMHAAAAGSEHVVRYLLSVPCPVDEKARNGETALTFAAARRHARVVRLLLDAGASVDTMDACGSTPLIRALAGTGNEDQLEEVVRALIDAGADPSVQDCAGRTAFSAARRKTTDWCVPLLGWNVTVYYPVRRSRIMRILRGARLR
jgi:hypothetical protein